MFGIFLYSNLDYEFEFLILSLVEIFIFFFSLDIIAVCFFKIFKLKRTSKFNNNLKSKLIVTY